MTTVMFFYAGMAVIIGVIFYVGYRVDRKNAHKREEISDEHNDPLDPTHL